MDRAGGQGAKPWLIACVAGIVAATVATSGAAGLNRRGSVATPLVGTWGKTVTSATWRKHGITYEDAGHWAITISNDGTLTLHNPPGHAGNVLTHMSARTAGGSLLVGATEDGFCPQHPGYAWKVTGTTLVMGGGGNDCDARHVLFTVGAWKKEG
jgi:hypothetical protein